MISVTELQEYFPVWKELTSEQQNLLAQSVIQRNFAKGERIHGTGKVCLGFLIIKKGQLRTYMISDNGREVTLYHLYDREMCLFSASCIMQNVQFDVFIQAEKETEVLQIPASLYHQLMNESLPMAKYTNDLMATHFTDVMWLVEQILFKRIDQRLAGFLLEQVKNENSDTFTMTHESIAQHLGTAREVVTRMLKYFQSEKWVSLGRGQIKIQNETQLQRLV
jgi:CRP/FNR family transcriptional regulator